MPCNKQAVENIGGQLIGPQHQKPNPSTLDPTKLFFELNHQTFSRYFFMYVPRNTKHPPQHHEFPKISHTFRDKLSSIHGLRRLAILMNSLKQVKWLCRESARTCEFYNILLTWRILHVYIKPLPKFYHHQRYNGI